MSPIALPFFVPLAWSYLSFRRHRKFTGRADLLWWLRYGRSRRNSFGGAYGMCYAPEGALVYTQVPCHRGGPDGWPAVFCEIVVAVISLLRDSVHRRQREGSNHDCPD
jgi:hypothetical protein